MPKKHVLNQVKFTSYKVDLFSVLDNQGINLDTRSHVGSERMVNISVYQMISSHCPIRREKTMSGSSRISFTLMTQVLLISCGATVARRYILKTTVLLSVIILDWANNPLTSTNIWLWSSVGRIQFVIIRRSNDSAADMGVYQLQLWLGFI